MSKLMKPTLKEMADAIGRRGLYKDGTIVFPVMVTDAKEAYGRKLLMVIPRGEGGSGEKWVAWEKVKLL